LALREVTVYASDFETLGANKMLDSGGFFLVQAEDEDAVGYVVVTLVIFEQLKESGLLIFLVDYFDNLPDSGVSAQFARWIIANSDFNGLFHKRICEISD
jgi:hypothetical protein